MYKTFTLVGKQVWVSGKEGTCALSLYALSPILEERCKLKSLVNFHRLLLELCYYSKPQLYNGQQIATSDNVQNFSAEFVLNVRCALHSL